MTIIEMKAKAYDVSIQLAHLQNLFNSLTQQIDRAEQSPPPEIPSSPPAVLPVPRPPPLDVPDEQ